jgi:hypothetical protein
LGGCELDVIVVDADDKICAASGETPNGCDDIKGRCKN